MTKITKDKIYDVFSIKQGSSNKLLDELFDKLNDNEKKEFVKLEKLNQKEKNNVLKLTFDQIKTILDEFLDKDLSQNHSLNRKEFDNVKVSEDHNRAAFDALDFDTNKKIDFAEYMKTILPE